MLREIKGRNECLWATGSDRVWATALACLASRLAGCMPEASMVEYGQEAHEGKALEDVGEAAKELLT